MKKIIFLALLGTTAAAPAQIVYHDIVPDVVFTASDPPGSDDNLYPIDLNNDGAKEFDFRWDAWSIPGGLVWFIHFYSEPGSSPTRQFITNPASSMLKPLQLGEAISPAQTYTSTFDPMLSTTGNDNFRGLGERYIGFRATIGSTVYYGWVRVSVEGFTTTVKDYAYTTDPGGITAGQTSLSVKEDAFRSGTVLFPNPGQGVVWVGNPAFTGEPFRYVLTDASGKSVRDGVSAFGEGINIGGIATGSYLFTITKGDMVLTERFIRQ